MYIYNTYKLSILNVFNYFTNIMHCYQTVEVITPISHSLV